MSKKSIIKVGIGFLLTLGVIVVFTYFYLYKEHRDIASEDANFEVTVEKLQNDFDVNDSLANLKYADKVIIVKGKITEMDSLNNSFIIDEKLVVALIDAKKLNLTTENQIKVKGRFLGYDDLLEEFKMDQCALVE